MKKAFVFPGQGAQFVGMGQEIYTKSEAVRKLFAEANEVLGFDLTKTMFEGTEEDLKQTKVTQPAVFLHSVAMTVALGEAFAPDMVAVAGSAFKPAMVAGHSLGEFSALVASRALPFADALRLVSERALAMQAACEARPSTMAAIIGLPDDKIEEVCRGISDQVVVPANYNCSGQVVISGTMEGIAEACELLKAAGAKRALPLKVGGAFHSPLMQPAKERLQRAIEATTFATPICPIYQNVDARPHTDVEEIKANLIAQLTAPVRWTKSVEAMVADGATYFVELGPGKVLAGLIGRIARDVTCESLATI